MTYSNNFITLEFLLSFLIDFWHRLKEHEILTVDIENCKYIKNCKNSSVVNTSYTYQMIMHKVSFTRK